MYLLDTNACIDFARARSERLRERLEQVFDAGLAISTITLAELRLGARADRADPNDDRLLDVLIRSIAALDFDADAAEQYAMIVRQVGVRRRSFDRLIAAHALSRNLVLVTSNERDFADIPGLRVEDWTK